VHACEPTVGGMCPADNAAKSALSENPIRWGNLATQAWGLRNPPPDSIQIPVHTHCSI